MSLQPGIHSDIPAADYHADRLTEQPTLSRSGIHTILNGTLAAFRAKSPRLTAHPELLPDERTDAKDLGSVVHDMMRGHKDSFIGRDCTDFKKKDGTPYETWSGAAKEWREEQRAAGMIVISRDTHALALQLTEKLGAACYRRFGPQWAKRTTEQTILWQRRLNDGTVIWCRARPDIVLPSGQLVDVKTTERGVSDEELGKSIALDGLDLQAAWYQAGMDEIRGANDKPFVFAYVQTVPPHTIRFVELPESWLNTARMRIDVACHRYGAALKSGVWPDWPIESRPDAPTWLKERWGWMLMQEGLIAEESE